jgi:molybdate transport system substrate-binding protein
MRGAAISLFLLLMLGALPSRADTATVAVAANFSHTLTVLATQFEQHSSHQLRISSGATGTLYAQIRQGAPFDIFLAADTLRPEQLVAQGYAQPQHARDYARGQLVLAGQQLNSPNLNQALQARTGKLAIANPKLAPYGAAAVQVLQQLAQWPLPQGQLVMGNNINQTTQFVVSGNAQLGLLALSQAKHQQLPYLIIPVERYTPLLQRALLLKRGETNPAATAFFDFLASDEARRIIAEHGYLAVAAS